MRRLLVPLACALIVAVHPRAAPPPLAEDRGAAGTWQKLLKLQTDASVMHTTCRS